VTLSEIEEKVNLDNLAIVQAYKKTEDFVKNNKSLLLDELLSTSSLSRNEGIDDYYGDCCIGISPGAIKNDETLIQAKQRVVESINKIFNTNFTEKDIKFMTDGGHD
jgi:hypothetical protein